MAGLLAVGIALAHSWLGERYILVRLLRRPDLPPLFGSDIFTKRTLRFAWHLTTVAWCGLGALLLRAAWRPAADTSATTQIVAATFLVSAVVAGIGSRGRHFSWIIFLGIAAAALLSG
jgi:hypothetical protein